MMGCIHAYWLQHSRLSSSLVNSLGTSLVVVRTAEQLAQCLLRAVQQLGHLRWRISSALCDAAWPASTCLYPLEVSYASCESSSCHVTMPNRCSYACVSLQVSIMWGHPPQERQQPSTTRRLYPHRTLLRELSCCTQLRPGNELRINAHVPYQRYTSQCLLQPAFDISFMHVMVKQRMLARLLVAGLLSECCLVCSSLHARSSQSCKPIRCSNRPGSARSNMPFLSPGWTQRQAAVHVATAAQQYNCTSQDVRLKTSPLEICCNQQFTS
jgi:hypothetical protein